MDDKRLDEIREKVGALSGPTQSLWWEDWDDGAHIAITQDIPYLLALVESQRAEIERLRAVERAAQDVVNSALAIPPELSWNVALDRLIEVLTVGRAVTLAEQAPHGVQVQEGA